MIKSFMAGSIMGASILVVGYDFLEWQYWLLLAAGVVQYVTGLADR